MTSQHPSKDRRGTFLGLRMRTAQANETSRAVLTCGQCAQVRAHVAHAAVRGEGRPFLGGWIPQALAAMKGDIEAAGRFSIFFDQRLRIELGVHDHRIDAGMAEERWIT